MIVYGDSAVRVRMGDAMETMFRRALDQAAPGLLAEIERSTRALYESARDEWPVKTGRSRSALEWGVRVEGDGRVAGFIRNPVPYLIYIRRKKDHKNPWITLVRQPAHRDADRLALAIAPMLRRELTHG